MHFVEDVISTGWIRWQEKGVGHSKTEGKITLIKAGKART